MISDFPQLWFYDRLNVLRFPGTFVGKLMTICFIGTHIPLIAFIVFLGAEAEWGNRSLQLVGIILLFSTLVGTGLALFAIHAMLSPLEVARVSLTNYRERGQLPRLPTHYQDAVGQLMREVELTVTRLHGALADLAREARVDPLTGIANRRALMEKVRDMARDTRAASGSVCCAIIDVDRFKTLNDTYGHAIGDRALIAVTRIMTSRVSPPGVVGRLGGDEFCILMPSGNFEATRQALEDVRAEVANSEIAGLPKGMVSLSMGLVECRDEDLTIQTMLARADTQLYRAKRSGRDQVSGERLRRPSQTDGGDFSRG